MSKPRVWRRAGFTLIELLVVIAIIAVLIGLLLPAVQKVREAAARTQTMNNVSQCAKAAHLAHDTFKKFPPYVGFYGQISNFTPGTSTPATWWVHLMPFVEQGPLYQTLVSQYNLGTADASVAPSVAPGNIDKVVPSYLSSQDPGQLAGGAGASNFAVNLAIFAQPGTYGGNIFAAGKFLTLGADLTTYPKMPATFPDGTSNTILYSTVYSVCGGGSSTWWAGPTLQANSNGGSSNVNTNQGAFFGSFNLALTAIGAPVTAGAGTSPANKIFQPAPKVSDCLADGTPQGFAPNSVTVAMVDASVRNVSAAVSTSTFAIVLAPADRLAIPADWTVD